MKSKMNLPGFNVLLGSTSPLRNNKEIFLLKSVKSAVVTPQALRLGGFGGSRWGSLGIDPLPPSCSECNYECTIVSCGPNCRRERCEDICTSVPCFS